MGKKIYSSRWTVKNINDYKKEIGELGYQILDLRWWQAIKKVKLIMKIKKKEEAIYLLEALNK